MDMAFAKKILSSYFLSLLLALTTAVIIIALRVEKSPVNIFLIFLGGLLGVLVYELEYFITAYWHNSESAFSSNLRSLVSQKNFNGVLMLIKSHRYSEEEKVIHSSLFQIICAVTSLLTTTSSNQILGLAFSLSAFTQSFYKMYEEYIQTKSLKLWFSIFKEEPNNKFIISYILLMLTIFIYILFQLPNKI